LTEIKLCRKQKSNRQKHNKSKTLKQALILKFKNGQIEALEKSLKMIFSYLNEIYLASLQQKHGKLKINQIQTTNAIVYNSLVDKTVPNLPFVDKDVSVLLDYSETDADKP